MYMKNSHVHHIIDTKLHCAPPKCMLVKSMRTDRKWHVSAHRIKCTGVLKTGTLFHGSATMALFDLVCNRPLEKHYDGR